MKYPVAILACKGNDITPTPCVLEAANADEAAGKALRMGGRLHPGAVIHVKVGFPDMVITDVDTVILTQEIVR